MTVIAFIEPPQAEVLERVLRHCGLGHASAPPAGDGRGRSGPRPGGRFGRPDGIFRRVLGTDYVDMDGILATFEFSPTPVRPWAIRVETETHPWFVA